MARKNVFAGVIEHSEAKPGDRPPLDFVPTGASRTLLSSFTEIAEQAERLREGETIIEIDPALVDDSFARDRFDLDDPEYQEEYAQVRDGIRDHGQDSPAVVRPHPQTAGRYILVFGHLRRKIALELGRKLRAVVRDISDRDHVIAQGQENNNRANTSFIEKARFAADIVSHKFDDDNSTVFEALSIDTTTLSKMLAVANLPVPLLDAIGRAKKTGRDRWYELKLLLDRPGSLEVALSIIEEPGFSSLRSDTRFERVLTSVKALGRRGRPSKASSSRNWKPGDGRLEAAINGSGRKFTIALKAKGNDAAAFGNFLSDNLNRFYEEFRSGKPANENGD